MLSTKNPKLSNFKKIETTRLFASLECLHSYLAQSADELWCSTKMGQGYLLRELIFYQNLGF